jgi:hypothetical protein
LFSAQYVTLHVTVGEAVGDVFFDCLLDAFVDIGVGDNGWSDLFDGPS